MSRLCETEVGTVFYFTCICADIYRHQIWEFFWALAPDFFFVNRNYIYFYENYNKHQYYINNMALKIEYKSILYQ